jgi:hypothetical protein
MLEPRCNNRRKYAGDKSGYPSAYRFNTLDHVNVYRTRSCINGNSLRRDNVRNLAFHQLLLELTRDAGIHMNVERDSTGRKCASYRPEDAAGHCSACAITGVRRIRQEWLLAP